MSDGEDGSSGLRPGPSHAGGDSSAPLAESGNQLLDLQTQLNELNQKHDAVMSSIASLGDVQPRSIVYVPREKQIVPFNGDPGKDAHSVDEFIEEVERAMSLRGLRERDQIDFILSHLRGCALEEIKLRTHRHTVKPNDLFSYLREAFREKRTTPQLLHAFYARRQSDGEDLRDYSHALSQLLNTALLTSPNAVTEPQLAETNSLKGCAILLSAASSEGGSERNRSPTCWRYVKRPLCGVLKIVTELQMWQETETLSGRVLMDILSLLSLTTAPKGT